MDKIVDQAQAEAFLDDCVAMVEALRCLEEKGVEGVDPDGVTLNAAVFDKCFPGVEWAEQTLEDGRPVGIRFKKAEYRGFDFDTLEVEWWTKQ